ncbi:MAG: HEAT repeat domain-containing protein [Candidatus Omnitrophica bacterium]|nr:HEAT repeat domain-containing protein [Candidatus Omnitrophota bacterium]
MYNYQFELVRTIDIALLGVMVLVSLAIAVSVFIQNHLWNRRVNRLLDIKMYIYPLVLAGKNPAGAADTPFIMRITPQQFLDIEMNRARDVVSFNDAERNFIRSCFISPQRIARLEKSALRSSDKVCRAEAILCLGHAGVKSATGVLKKLLLSKDKDITYFSIIALSQIKTTSSAKALLDFLRKTPPSSHKIISILEDFPPDIVSDVITLVDDPDPRVRVWGMKLLSRFPAERYIKKIEKFTNDKNTEVRAYACECLGNISHKESKETLLECLKDESWLVRMHAVKALSKALGDEAIPAIMPFINDASWSVNSAVRDAMAEHIKASMPYIERFLTGKDVIAQKYSLEVLRDTGYIANILKDAVSGNDKEKACANHLLEAMIKIKAYFGLEAGIDNLDKDTRAKVLEMLNGIDKEFVKRVRKM